MNKLILLSFLTFLLFSCKQSISVDKSELKKIFTELIIADSVKTKYFLIDSIQNFEKKSIAQSNTTYLIASYSLANNGIWTNEIFDSAKIITNTQLQSISNSNPFTMTPVHYSFSLPYFSKDKKSFIIYYNYYCGNLCAEYSLRLYKYINGKWVFIKSYFKIVS
jgi:hypothetical protein